MSTLLHVTLIQSNIYWEDKKRNVDMWQNKLQSLPNATELVILPEMFTTGFSMQTNGLAETMEGPTVQWMKVMAKNQRIILTGSIIIEEKNYYYNRLIWMLPNGEYAYYDKRHLFFANENKYYTPGQKRLVTSVKGWKILLLICYDLRFPVWSSQQIQNNATGKHPEYDAIIYVANWPEARMLAWRALLQARAIENQCYVIGVNRIGEDGNRLYHSGESMVIDPLGAILYCKKHEEDIFSMQLDKEHLNTVRQSFPFWKDADMFIRCNSGDVT